MKLTDQARTWFHRFSAASQETYTRLCARLPETRQLVAQELASIPRTRLTVAATSSLLLLGGAVGVGCNAVHSTPQWNQVYTNGSLVGVVPNNNQLAINMQRVALGYHIALDLVPVHTVVPSNYDWRLVASLPTQAASIRLNGTPLVFTTGAHAAQRVLRAVKQALSPTGVSAQGQFQGHVTVVSAKVPVARVVSEQTAVRLLLGSGTSGQSAARSTSLLPAAAHAVMSNTRSTSVQHAPRELSGSHTGPATGSATSVTPRLHVLAVRQVTRVVQVTAPITYVDNSQLSTSVEKVLKSGVPGSTRQRVEVHFIDRQVSSEQVLSQQSITSPQAEVIERGTNPGVAAGTWNWPTDTTVITSPFGWRYLGGVHEFHPGVDIGCAMGSPIYATNNGYVEDAGWNSGGYGIWVRINNGDGIETVFGHMSKVSVTPGQVVGKGELLGYSGDTGEATGPHLHYEVRKWGTPISPEPYM